MAMQSWVSIGSYNDLAPHRRQAITWTNVDLWIPFVHMLVKFEIKNTKFSSQENAIENVFWKLTAILFRSQFNAQCIDDIPSS